jgi:glycerophosphoryl diester phosphodiesterase
MTRIIGHRGAAGLALENSPESIKAALRSDVDAVEFDLRRTRDHKLVVMHDADTGRVASEKVRIRDKTLDELRRLKLNNGQPIPTIDDVLDVLGSKPLHIELKDDGSVGELLRALDRHPKAHVSVVSFQHNELYALRERRPDIPVYVLEHFSPIDIIHSARRLRARGIGLNKWLMNPLTYRLAQRYGLELYLYTVNGRWIGHFLKRLYPAVNLCTDHPERFTDIRDKR